MKVATWNINGLRARFEFLLHWLEARQPDLVGLQELKMAEERFPFEALKARGYHAVVHGQKAWNGVAILSRDPPQIRERGLPGEEEMGARLISAEAGGLKFTTIYCPNGKSVDHADFPRKLKWLESLAEHLEERRDPSEPAVLCGDFNICPTPLDSWNEEEFSGEIFHTPEERARFQRLLEWGWLDAYRELFPGEQAFSWWDYRAGAFYKNHGLRIDFLLVTPVLKEGIRSAGIDREYRKKKEGLTASDHAPVLVELGA